MIPLDIFLKSQQNISSKLEAWLTLIASDDMKRIREVLQAYPEFGEIYYQVLKDTAYQAALSEINRLKAQIEASAKIDRDYKNEGDETT